MNINTRAPHFILASVKRIYPELPTLVGDDWTRIQQEVDELIAQMEARPNQRMASIELMDILAEYDAAQKRLKDENTVQAVISKNIEDDIAEIAQSLGFDADTVDGLVAATYKNMRWDVDKDSIPDDEVTTKSVTLKPGGVEGGKSVKFKNMNIDWGDFAKISAGFVTTGFDIIDKPHPLLIAAGALLTIAALHDVMTIDLSEQEASVFWGFIVAAGDKSDKQARGSDILTATNTEREKYGRDALNEKQLTQALTKLERIHSIKQIDDTTWQIIERYSVED